MSERSVILSRRIRGGLCCLALWSLVGAYGQIEEEAVMEGEFLENVIVERDWALRMRGEISLTEDEHELIDDDIAYARFPDRIYATEVKALQRGGSSVAASYARWRNRQDLDAQRWSWKMRVPLRGTAFTDVDYIPPYLSLSYRYYEGDDDLPDRHYWYAGLDRSFRSGVYALLQYRLAAEDGGLAGHQLYEYLSWKISQRFRVGEQAAVSRSEGTDDLGPWYARLSATAFLVRDWTSLRLDAQHYDTGVDLEYQEYNTYLYQRIGGRSFLRLNYRHYRDSNELTSGAWGLKLKHYFTARLAAHAGYRFYDHSDAADFDTVFAGVHLLL
jgi:hypothetical protein